MSSSGTLGLGILFDMLSMSARISHEQHVFVLYLFYIQERDYFSDSDMEVPRVVTSLRFGENDVIRCNLS